MARGEGVTVTELGERFGVSHQRISAVMKSVTALVDKVDLDLMLARRDGEACVFVIPFSEDYTLALDFSDYLVARLRARGMKLDVQVHRASNGLVLELVEIPKEEQ